MAKIKTHEDHVIRYKVKSFAYGHQAWITISGYEVFRTSYSTTDPKLAMELLEESFTSRLRKLLEMDI